ncbi:srs domain-containing protein, partial [Cystoisospora suis]
DSAGLVEAQPRRLTESPVSQCSFEGEKTLTVPVSPYTLEAKFSCGITSSNGITVDPDCATQQVNCCASPSATDGSKCQQQTISQATGVNGSASMDKTSYVITVKLEGTPTNTAGKLYFWCKKSQETCVVIVSMPEALPETQCNFNKNVSLPAISDPNKEATFQCGGTVKGSPDDTQVFNGPDCAGNASKLSDLVPGAQLTKGKDGTFTLSVAALPSDAQNLCFKCIYPDPTKPKDTDATCKVTVTVSGTSKTTTASTTTSAAEGIAVTSFAAVAVAFFSFAGNAYY